MSKSNSQFRFKQFAVSHHRSSMKVGVDGVLIGCWASLEGALSILDVGTGCGLISLIIAQRTQDAMIDAIDIDAPSIEEAKENFSGCPWTDRLRASKCSYADSSSLLTEKERGFDLIISNPPYFDSGVTKTNTAREKARHQGDLSPLSLLKEATGLLEPGGSVAMIVPTEIYAALEEKAEDIGFSIERKCFVRGHKDAPFKRVMLQWRNRRENGIEIPNPPQFLTLELSPGVPTEEYRALCRDFYLRF